MHLILDLLPGKPFNGLYAIRMEKIVEGVQGVVCPKVSKDVGKSPMKVIWLLISKNYH